MITTLKSRTPIGGPAHRRGMTVLEVLVALTIFGAAMTAVTRQLIESASLTLKTSRMLEYARNGRNLVERLNEDVRSAQSISVFDGFVASPTAVVAGNDGNYVLLQQLTPAGTVSRTIGYYAVAIGSTGTHRLHRFEVDGSTVPDASLSGTHETVVSTLRLPEGRGFFQNRAGLGISIRGQYGTTPGARTNLNYIQCTLITRS